MYTTRITAPELHALRGAAALRVIDCRFDLADPAHGEAAYRSGHAPGALYAHLDRDLSGPPVTDHGRHPLPTPRQLTALFSRLGIHPNSQVVAYDALCGGLAAARLWWLLRNMGYPHVAVLDGGINAWCERGFGLDATLPAPVVTEFAGQFRHARVVMLACITPALSLVDARDPARYHGEHEPIDPRAGHIPGARNHFWRANLGPDGVLLDPAELREAFRTSLGTLPDAATVHYCGSGVSACHNVLAQVHAGLPEPRVYCGSWSEWSRDPQRPIALGPESVLNRQE